MKKLKALAIERLKAMPKSVWIGDHHVQVLNVNPDATQAELEALQRVMYSGVGIPQRFLLNIDMSNLSPGSAVETVVRWKHWLKKLETAFGHGHQAPPP